MKLQRFTQVTLATASAALLATVLQATAAQAAGTPLRDLAEQRGIQIGTAVDSSALTGESAYEDIVSSQFSSVTAENVMKWDTVEPSQGQLNFGPADALVDYANEHGQQVRGHTLVWHSQVPGWITDGVNNGSIDADQLREILHQHITDEVSHFKGEIYQWDVVNEIFDDNGSLRDSVWSQQLGDTFIADAFRWAHEADPDAKLFMNDYSIESVGAKSDAYLALAQRLLDEGVPIDGVGFQAHLDIQYGFPNDLATNLQRFDALGLETAITEADVRMNTPADDTKLARQASDYTGLLSACLATPGCTSFTVWGFTDKHSWVPDTFPGEGAATLYDENYQPKPAYTALQTELAGS